MKTEKQIRNEIIELAMERTLLIGKFEKQINKKDLTTKALNLMHKIDYVSGQIDSLKWMLEK